MGMWYQRWAGTPQSNSFWATVQILIGRQDGWCCWPLQRTVEQRGFRRHNPSCSQFNINIVMWSHQWQSTPPWNCSILPTSPATPALEDNGRWLAKRLNTEDTCFFLNLEPHHRHYLHTVTKALCLSAGLHCLHFLLMPKPSTQANVWHPSQGKSGFHPCRFVHFAFCIWLPTSCF